VTVTSTGLSISPPITLAGDSKYLIVVLKKD
jgi:hypothetical protein